MDGPACYASHLHRCKLRYPMLFRWSRLISYLLISLHLYRRFYCRSPHILTRPSTARTDPAWARRIESLRSRLLISRLGKPVHNQVGPQGQPVSFQRATILSAKTRPDPFAPSTHVDRFKPSQAPDGASKTSPVLFDLRHASTELLA